MAADDAIRASDADREDVVTILGEAYAAGRLTLAEFDQRTSAAFAARTWGELRELTRDLPGEPPFAEAPPAPAALPAGPARPAGSVPGEADRQAERQAAASRQGWPGGSRLIPALPIAFVWLAIAVFAHTPGAFVPIAVLLLMGLKSAAGQHPGRDRGPGRRF